MEYVKIPKHYQVGGTDMEVRRVERCPNNSIGQAYTAAGYIEIADIYDKDTKQSETCKVNSFYHELVHTILGTMGEFDLNNNERFVNSFASFLTEAMRNAYFLESNTAELLEIMEKAEKYDKLINPKPRKQ